MPYHFRFLSPSLFCSVLRSSMSLAGYRIQGEACFGFVREFNKITASFNLVPPFFVSNNFLPSVLDSRTNS